MNKVIVPTEPTHQMWDSAENAQIMFCEDALDTPKDALPTSLQQDMASFPTARIWMWVCGYRAALEHAPQEPSMSEIVGALQDGRDAAEVAMNACAQVESPHEQEYADLVVRINAILDRLAYD